MFGVQARFAAEDVRIEGESSEYVRISDEGDPRTFHFCPHCGATVYFPLSDGASEFIAVPVGAFADPSFPAPVRSIYESRQHPWVTLAALAEHHD